MNMQPLDEPIGVIWPNFQVQTFKSKLFQKLAKFAFMVILTIIQELVMLITYSSGVNMYKKAFIVNALTILVGVIADKSISYVIWFKTLEQA